ncbi:MAG: DUF4968 domain-containing protein, partial [Bacteroidia bacterium]|nr:DUF4968 domain-containing protein [Bacteroidia bacterium]
MKKNRICLSLITGLVLASCATRHYEKTNDGIIVNISHAKDAALSKLRLQVLGNDLIHVSATPDNVFPKDSSLIIVPNIGTAPFKVTEVKDSIQLATETLNVLISSKDGGVKFKDKNGKIILAESSGGGKTFSPIEVEGT